MDRDLIIGQSIVAWAAATGAATYGYATGQPWAPVAALVSLALLVWGWAAARRLARDLAALRRAAFAHRGALLKNLRGAVKRDDYGTVTTDHTDAAVATFTASIGVSIPIDTARTTIEAVLTQAPTRPQTGTEFEHATAEALTRAGWDAQVTQGSGDQGIDVIAKRGALTVGLQCKRQSRPVGNKAVQEAAAGRAHYGLRHAAVVSNARFTPAATALATSTDVLLLAPEDLPRLATRLTSATSPVRPLPDRSNSRSPNHRRNPQVAP
ncbi:MAG: restriction endonuclease [Pseudomonadota bacterium]